VNYATSNGTARSGSDYVAASGVLTIPAGSPSGTITISVVGDTTKEKTETFAVTLSSAVNATIADGTGLASILDDDSTPQLNATSTRTTEGSPSTQTMTSSPTMSAMTSSRTVSTMSAMTAGATDTTSAPTSLATSPTTTMMTFAVVPTNANSEPMTVDYVTVADPTTTTREGIDFVPVTGTITFPAESTEPVLVQVPVVADRRHEHKQRVFLKLLNPVEAVAGVDGQGDIEDDDPIPTVSIADITVGEASVGKMNAVLTVTLSNDSDDPVTVNYTTADGSAIGGTDFQALSGVLTFQPGETTQVITLGIAPDVYNEGIESFNVVLSTPTNATLGKAQAIVTITPPLAWVTSTADEFAKGSLTGTAVTQTANGELTLSPTLGAEFTDTKLPAGWTTAVLTAGGTAAIADGTVTVDGLSLGFGTAYTAGHSLEFAAKFAATGLQQIGFAVPGGVIPPLAVFAMKADGQLYARSATATKSMDTPLGKLAGTAHRFRIDWSAATIDYWVDGAKLASHAVSLGAATLAMRPVIADQGVGDGAVKVDWIRMTPYAASGSYISQVYDAGVQVAWQVLQAAGDIPAGTSVIVDVRTGDTATPDATWTVFRAVTPGDSIASFARYAQYRVRLATSDPAATPAIKEIALAYLK